MSGSAWQMDFLTAWADQSSNSGACGLISSTDVPSIASGSSRSLRQCFTNGCACGLGRDCGSRGRRENVAESGGFAEGAENGKRMAEAFVTLAVVPKP
jgi:hypothetical protein